MRVLMMWFYMDLQMLSVTPMRISGPGCGQKRIRPASASVLQCALSWAYPIEKVRSLGGTRRLNVLDHATEAVSVAPTGRARWHAAGMC